MKYKATNGQCFVPVWQIPRFLLPVPHGSWLPWVASGRCVGAAVALGSGHGRSSSNPPSIKGQVSYHPTTGAATETKGFPLFP